MINARNKKLMGLKPSLEGSTSHPRCNNFFDGSDDVVCGHKYLHGKRVPHK